MNRGIIKQGMYGRVQSVRDSPAVFYTVLLVGDVFALEGLRFRFGTGTHSSLRKGCALPLILVHVHVSFEILNVQQCCSTGAGHLHGDCS